MSTTAKKKKSSDDKKEKKSSGARRRSERKKPGEIVISRADDSDSSPATGAKDNSKFNGAASVPAPKKAFADEGSGSGKISTKAASGASPRKGTTNPVPSIATEGVSSSKSNPITPAASKDEGWVSGTTTTGGHSAQLSTTPRSSAASGENKTLPTNPSVMSLAIRQVNEAVHVGSDAGDDKIVPIMLSIELPQELGGTVHQLVLHQNISIDQVKIALWKQVPSLWDGPSRHDYNLMLIRTKHTIDVEFKKILSFDAINSLYQSKKKLKFKLVSKKTQVIAPKAQVEEMQRRQTTVGKTPWQIEGEKLAKQLQEAEQNLYRVQKRLKEWKTAVDNQLTGVRGGGSVIISHEKRVILQVVSQKIQTILDGKDEGNQTDSESDEEIEVPDGHVFLPRSLNQSIFERFGGRAAGGPSGPKADKGKKLTPEEHLERIRSEILSTEEAYVDGLEILVKIYYQPLAASETLMSLADVETIFANIKSIQQIHTQLLLDLQKCPKGDLKSLSSAFAHFVPFLKMYTEYVNGFDKSAKRIDKLETNARVKAFFEECRKKPECQNLDLRSYLITPIQRLPRYELLLRDLHKHIPDNQPEEKKKIADLLATVASVNSHVNESKRAAERRQRLYYLKDAALPKGVDIFSRPDRNLVKEDTLPVHVIKKEEVFDNEARETLSLGNLKFRKRYFFLFDDMLVEVRELKSGKYKFMRNYDMLNLTVCPSLPLSQPEAGQSPLSLVKEHKQPLASSPSATAPPAGTEGANGEVKKELTLVLVENPVGGILREFVIKAKSIEEKEEWIAAIKKACDKALRLSQKGAEDSDSEDEGQGGDSPGKDGGKKGKKESGESSAASPGNKATNSKRDVKETGTAEPKKFRLFGRKKESGKDVAKKGNDPKKDDKKDDPKGKKK